MGMFELQYKYLYPDLSAEDNALLRKYPEHREFIFEQLLKAEKNMAPDILTQSQASAKDFPFIMFSVMVVVLILFFVFNMK
jgi:hypothetical protein